MPLTPTPDQSPADLDLLIALSVACDRVGSRSAVSADACGSTPEALDGLVRRSLAEVKSRAFYRPTSAGRAMLAAGGER